MKDLKDLLNTPRSVLVLLALLMLMTLVLSCAVGALIARNEALTELSQMQNEVVEKQSEVLEKQDQLLEAHRQLIKVQADRIDGLQAELASLSSGHEVREVAPEAVKEPTIAAAE